jgi:hypothetical protein
MQHLITTDVIVPQFGTDALKVLIRVSQGKIRRDCHGNAFGAGVRPVISVIRDLRGIGLRYLEDARPRVDQLAQFGFRGGNDLLGAGIAIGRRGADHLLFQNRQLGIEIIQVRLLQNDGAPGEEIWIQGEFLDLGDVVGKHIKHLADGIAGNIAVSIPVWRTRRGLYIDVLFRDALIQQDLLEVRHIAVQGRVGIHEPAHIRIPLQGKGPFHKVAFEDLARVSDNMQGFVRVPAFQVKMPENGHAKDETDAGDKPGLGRETFPAEN